MMPVVRIMLIVVAVAITSVLTRNTLEQKLISKESDIHGKELDINASRVRRSYYGHCFNTDTWFTNDGNGDSSYLDRQSPNCGLFAMRSFHLVRNSDGDKVRYDLSCCHLPKDFKCQTSTLHTKFNDDGNGHVIFLDRHHVSCPNEGVLKHFHLNQNDKGALYRYTYSCCSPPARRRYKMMCYDNKTPLIDYGKGDMVNLDEHRPSCHFGYFLNGFLLYRKSSTIQYKYRCCAFHR